MVDPLLRPPIGFAHRGGRAHAPENTIEAFRLALRLGATGLESDVWVTADGVAVLHHDRSFRAGPRRRRIPHLDRAALPPFVPSLEDLYRDCGTGFDLSLDLKDDAALDAVLSVARAAGAADRLWLCHPDWELLASWREKAGDAHLVCSTRMRVVRQGPERLAAQLADAGIDAINMHQSDWTAGLTTLFHRFERYAFGWDAQHDRILMNLLRMGIDAVYSDWVDRMTDALGRATS